ncbi:MAG: HD domain-containing protein [Desulfobulbaceae bacterium]|nr:HD domain-containing protein [Desulfobulbaceae bacterium]HIJ89572.1 HD domain-containing protein [Deltaproteobacteria bacterium]
MTQSQLLSTILVVPGIIFLISAVRLCVKTRRQVPLSLAGKWQALTSLILFFIVGYLLFIVVQVRKLVFPVEIITGLVFLGGSFFVFLVIGLSRLTIAKVRETDRAIVRANTALVQKNTELEKEIVARLEAEGRARARLQHLTTLHGIDMVITASLDLRLTMKLFLEQTVSQLGMDAGAILLLNTHTQTLDYGADWGFEGMGIRKTRVRLGEGGAGLAAYERRVFHVADLNEHPNPFSRHELLRNEKFITYYAIPLIAKGQVKGVFEIYCRQRFVAEPEWFDFFEALAIQAAIAIDNATLFRKLQESNIELTLAYDTTIEGWAKALELRDSETEGHTQRVTEITMKVACALGIREDELDHVRRGALLHDIGKMAVPDTVLMNTGPLSEEEQQIMQQHPGFAFDLLSPIHYLRPALDIPYCHHEWWDGNGYPRGLKGEQIPLAARIFSIADAWDALISARRYREAWPQEKVAEHIRSLAGTQFDPNLVDIFLATV